MSIYVDRDRALKMKKEEIKSCRLLEKYIKVHHKSGLDIYLYPKKGYNSTYAIFGTKYGSINNDFLIKGEKDPVEVPYGIAHYLEHKLFESEDGDAFARYAKTGAMANAYTSFDKTCYLFSCTDNFKESLEILLDFVQSPYFTEQTVKKEQGIIGQEIRMYDDDPGWRVLFNLLGALYHNHPVKIDIAGTVESIAEITAEKLYKCYNSFYNLNNMALCIVGDINADEVLKLIDKMLKPSEKVSVKNIFPQEPEQIVEKRVEQKFEVSVPMFQLGFKELAGVNRCSTKELAYTDIILEIMTSKASPLYKELMDKGLINSSSFGAEYFEGEGFSCIIFSGESRNPDEVAEIIKSYADKMHENGIDNKEFELAKKALYGKTLGSFNSIENIANILIDFSFSNRELFEYVDAVAESTVELVNERLSNQLLSKNSALSIVSPIKK